MSYLEASFTKQLLKIRQLRHDNAQNMLFKKRQEVEAAQKKLQDIWVALKKFEIFRSKKIASLYQNLIGKKITIKELNEVRLNEVKLNEQKAALKADCSNSLLAVEEKKKELDQAQKLFLSRQKSLNKAEQIDEEHAKLQAQSILKNENDKLDEFRVTRKLLPALSLVFLVFFSMGAMKEKTLYRAIQQNLPLLLQDVANRFDLTLKMADIPNIRVKNEYEIRSISEFLQNITKRYKLDWLISDDVLYIVPQKSRKERAFSFANTTQMEGFYYHLNQKRKIISKNFPLKRSTENSTLTWKAPEIFLRLIEVERQKYLDGDFDKDTIGSIESVKLMPNSQTGYGVMIFHLENAWATDKEYKFAENTYKVPGVASMIRNLTGAMNSKGQSKNSTNEASEASKKQRLNDIENSIIALNPLAAPRRQKEEQNQASAPNELATPTTSNSHKKREEQGAIVTADERLNTVLVYDKHENYDYYKELITHMDRKSSLVEIEAMIVDIAKSNINDLGIDWRAQKGKNAAGFGNFGKASTEGGVGISIGISGLATALSDNLSGVLARIRFLETKGKSRIVSRPSIVTMDNLEAVINTTQRFYVRVSGFQDSSLYPVEAGTTLRVTPHIIRSKIKKMSPHIRLFVTIEDGAIDQSQDAAVDDVPAIQENKIKTQAVVAQGASLLIGGHIHTTRIKDKYEVPVLGSIPLIGYLFKSETTIEREFIRLFIIRPRVMSGASYE